MQRNAGIIFTRIVCIDTIIHVKDPTEIHYVHYVEENYELEKEEGKGVDKILHSINDI